MIDNVQPATERAPTAAPAPVAPEKPATPAVSADDTLLLDDDTADEAAGAEGPAPAEGEPVEKPAWARPDDEEAANEWREERGVPLEPDDYDLPIPEEAQNDATFRETISGFTNLAHSLDLPQKGAAKLYEFVERRGQEIMAARIEQDRSEAAATKQALAEQWGDRANDNLKSVNGLLKTLPADLSKAVREARLANGLGGRLANNSAFLQLLADYASLKAGGQSVGVFDAEADAARIKAIELTRRNNIDEYFKNDMHIEIERLQSKKAARAPAAEGPRPGDATREAEIKAAMRRNFQEYSNSSMPAELTAIHKRRGAT